MMILLSLILMLTGPVFYCVLTLTGIYRLYPVESVLTDHQNTPFDSASLVGKNAALYLFYRGDW